MDHTVLYVQVSGPDYYQHLLAINMATSQIVAELDTQGLLEAFTIDGDGNVLATYNDVLLSYTQPALPSASARGDPLFIGLLGQRFQVHGLADEVYSIISSPTLQVNARFVFLSHGVCPLSSVPQPGLCFSHPGSYFGSVSVQTQNGQRLLIEAGEAKQGFQSVQLDGRQLLVGDEVGSVEGTGTVTVDGPVGSQLHVRLDDPWHVSVQVGLWRLQLDSSDWFVNIAQVQHRDWSALRRQERPHGLLGQTWQRRGEGAGAEKRRTSSAGPRDIEGDVDDYVLADRDMWAVPSAYNRFEVRPAPDTARAQ